MNNINIKEVPFVVRPLFRKPYDIRSEISSLTNLANELPLNIRYEGLIVYVKDIHLPYIFVNGVDDTNFISLIEFIQSNLLSVNTLSINTNLQIIEDLIYIDDNSYRYKNKDIKTSIKSFELFDNLTNEKISVNYEFVNNELIIYSRLRGLYKIKIHI